jgi:hypothetical protein
MSLEYKIFWIDDDDELPRALEEALNLEFDDHFDFDIEVEGDGSNLEAKLASEPIDLLVLDWNIGGEKSGLDLIRELRASGELTEIIFYSQDDGVQDACREFPGVHACTKVEADSKISALINRFLERSKNVAIMRGMIISEAIDLENRLTDIVIDLFGDRSELFRYRVMNKRIFDFGKKHTFLMGVLKDFIREQEESDEPDANLVARIRDKKNILREMNGEIINQRNILAHSKKRFEEGVLVLDGLNRDGGIRFDDDWKNQIRANIKKHLSNLREIRQELVLADRIAP